MSASPLAYQLVSPNAGPTPKAPASGASFQSPEILAAAEPLKNNSEIKTSIGHVFFRSFPNEQLPRR